MMMTMMRATSQIFLLLSFLSVAASTSLASNGMTTSFGRQPTLFGVPRGGGLFGGKSGGSDTKTEEATTTTPDGKTLYPALTQTEIEEWLEHVPVFAVTDPNGAGVVLRPENDTSVFYFFLNPMQANATLTQLKGVNPDMDLKVSAFSLGKIWFNLLQGADGKETILKSVDGSATAGENGDGSQGTDADTTTAKDVEYRLVPDTRDLLGARMLLTMSPEDGEKLKESGGMTPEMAQAAIKKAMEESPKFKETYNEIPVFTIAQMRMQKQASEGDDGEPVTLLPMYFSMQNMVATWQEFMKSAPPDVQGVEPAINLMSLHELVELMQKESEIDWRHVVLVPLAAGSGGDTAGSSGAATTAASADPMVQMGGATLGDD